MTELKKKSNAPVIESSKTWSHRTVGLSILMAKEGELVKRLRKQRIWAKEQLKELVEKKEDLLDALREQGKWNEEQHGKDWHAVLTDAFTQHHRDIDALVVLWEK